MGMCGSNNPRHGCPSLLYAYERLATACQLEHRMLIQEHTIYHPLLARLQYSISRTGSKYPLLLFSGPRLRLSSFLQRAFHAALLSGAYRIRTAALRSCNIAPLNTGVSLVSRASTACLSEHYTACRLGDTDGSMNCWLIKGAKLSQITKFGS